jgi:hypothetical protein
VPRAGGGRTVGGPAGPDRPALVHLPPHRVRQALDRGRADDGVAVQEQEGMELAQGELAVAAQQSEADGSEPGTVERAGVVGLRRQRRLVRSGWPPRPSLRHGRPQLAMDGEGLFVGSPLAVGPVGRLAIEPVERVDGTLPASFEQVPVEPGKADGEAGGRVGVVVEPARRRWQGPVGSCAQVHGVLLGEVGGGRRAATPKRRRSCRAGESGFRRGRCGSAACPCTQGRCRPDAEAHGTPRRCGHRPPPAQPPPFTSARIAHRIGAESVGDAHQGGWWGGGRSGERYQEAGGQPCVSASCLAAR